MLSFTIQLKKFTEKIFVVPIKVKIYSSILHVIKVEVYSSILQGSL